MRTVIAYWRRHGVRCSVYLDDFIVIAENVTELRNIRDSLSKPTLD